MTDFQVGIICVTVAWVAVLGFLIWVYKIACDDIKETK